MATGSRPFRGDNPASVISAVLKDHPASVNEVKSELPNHLGRIVKRCLEKDRECRYQSARDVKNELEGLWEENKSSYRLATVNARAVEKDAPTEGASDASAPATQDAATISTGRKMLWLAAAVVLLAVVALSWFFWAGRSDNGGEEVTANEKVPEDTRSIAVLPFTNMSSNPENEYSADGLSEEILNRLTSLSGLRVTSRTSSFSFKGRAEDLRAIGDFLGVAHILEGSVRRQADEVRVTAQLVRVHDGFHLWSDTFDSQLSDVFAVQEKIAESVAGALDVLLNEESRGVMQNAGVRNVEAFVAYQRGLELADRAHDFDGHELFEMLAEANTYFDEAIGNVPDFSAAYFARSDYYAHLAFRPGGSFEQQERAVKSFRDELESAVRTARDPKRRALIGFDLALFSEDWTQTRLSLEEAVRLPGCRSSNWTDELGALLPTVTEKFASESLACDPLNLFSYYSRSRALVHLGRTEEALAVLNLGVSKLGRKLLLSIYRVKVLLALQRFDEARAEARSIEVRSSRVKGLETLILATEGNLDGARQHAEIWFADYPGQVRHDRGGSMALQLAAATGQRELANDLATQLDGLPAGAMSLMNTVNACFCGAPFDIEATPHFQARLREAKLSWPPSSPIKYPAKSW